MYLSCMPVARAITFNAHYFIRFCFIVANRSEECKREISKTGRPVDFIVNSKNEFIFELLIMINNTLNTFLIIKLCYSNVLSNATAILNTSVSGMNCSHCFIPSAQ